MNRHNYSCLTECYDVKNNDGKRDEEQQMSLHFKLLLHLHLSTDMSEAACCMCRNFNYNCFAIKHCLFINECLSRTYSSDETTIMVRITTQNYNNCLEYIGNLKIHTISNTFATVQISCHSRKTLKARSLNTFANTSFQYTKVSKKASFSSSHLSE